VFLLLLLEEAVGVLALHQILMVQMVDQVVDQLQLDLLVELFQQDQETHHQLAHHKVIQEDKVIIKVEQLYFQTVQYRVEVEEVLLLRDKIIMHQE